MENLENVERY